MKLGQIKLNGVITAAIFEDGGCRAIPGHTLLDVVNDPSLLKKADSKPVAAEPVIPITPPEVWGCGCTYQTSANFRDAEHGTREGMYAMVYNGERPEVFFKGTARHVVGPNEAIGVRSDSKFTAPEPELALILGPGNSIFGVTIANDVSAWDIERENALYLTQSKVYDRCCSIGAAILQLGDGVDPYNLAMTCTIERKGQVLFSGETNTSKLHRKFEQLVEFLTRANKVPAGTVLLTGTGIIVTQEGALAEGDVVTITVPGIGQLKNTVAIV